MSIISSNTIIVVLTAIILALIFVVIKLNIQYYKEKKRFKKKMGILEEIIVQISKNKSGQLDKIKLSEELRENLKIINTTLSSYILELNQELFKILSKNNMI
jgi:hypothetical protein